jgi:hypothetical protein
MELLNMSRARNLAEYETLDGFMTDESLNRGMAYEPASTDIFVSPYAKCGTTWMQQIVHGLRTRGSMDFEEITGVTPWLELAYDMGVDLNADQVAHPRVFKSHLRWDQLPKGGRYIVVLRDPVDAMMSLMRFLEGWFFERGSISLEEFAQHFLTRGDDGYWAHTASWWRVRDREDVLLVCYEDMKLDLAGTVDLVADHLGHGYDEECRAIATRQSEFSFMKAHADQFDDRIVRRTRDPAMGLEAGPPSGKVATGKVKAAVPADIRASLDAHWLDTLGAEFGLNSYGDMRSALAAHRLG